MKKILPALFTSALLYLSSQNALAEMNIVTEGNTTIATATDVAESEQEILDTLEEALVSQGLISRGQMHIQEMFDRTGEALGHETLFSKAAAVEFCSAKQSYLMAKADPRNIVHCPYTIAFYETIDEPGIIKFIYQQPTLWGEGETKTEAEDGIAQMYKSILEEAMGFL